MRRPSGKKRGKALAAPYVATPEEAVALAALERRKAGARSGPRLKSKTTEDDSGHIVCKVEADHPDLNTAYDLMMESFGITERPLLAGMLIGLSGLAQDGTKTDAAAMNLAVSIVRGVGPRDPVEALLASQMAAIHMSTMKFANLTAATPLYEANLPRLEARSSAA